MLFEGEGEIDGKRKRGDICRSEALEKETRNEIEKRKWKEWL